MNELEPPHIAAQWDAYSGWIDDPVSISKQWAEWVQKRIQDLTAEVEALRQKVETHETHTP